MIKIIFAGAGPLAAPVFQSLYQLTQKHTQLQISGLITQPDKPAGRHKKLTPCPFKNFLQTHPIKFTPTPLPNPSQNTKNIPLYEPQQLKKEAPAILKHNQPDLIIVTDYGQIVPDSLLFEPAFGCLNLHHSLLPDLRGATPVQTALLKGYQETGTTLQIMAPQMDKGHILAQKKHPINLNHDFQTLGLELSQKAGQLLRENLLDYLHKKITPKPQDENKATYCWQKDFSKDQAQINWQQPTRPLHNHIRAFSPTPGAWTLEPNHNRLTIISTTIPNPPPPLSPLPPGTLTTYQKKLYVHTKTTPLQILSLQPAGKKELLATAFINGYRQKLPLQLQFKKP